MFLQLFPYRHSTKILACWRMLERIENKKLNHCVVRNLNGKDENPSKKKGRKISLATQNDTLIVRRTDNVPYQMLNFFSHLCRPPYIEKIKIKARKKWGIIWVFNKHIFPFSLTSPSPVFPLPFPLTFRSVLFPSKAAAAVSSSTFFPHYLIEKQTEFSLIIHTNINIIITVVVITIIVIIPIIGLFLFSLLT